MAEALKRGYATASTDTGHIGNTAAPFLGHPEKLVDFAYRAVNEMTIKAKAIINAFYDTPSRGERHERWAFLGPVRRFQLRARLGPPWLILFSPLTDPAVQIFRSGFFRRDSPLLPRDG
jgi:hypothetical protein